MTHLRDLDRRVVAQLYDGVADGQRMHEAFEALAGRFGCTTGTITAVDPVEPRAAAKLGVGAFNPSSCASYNVEYAAFDPAPAATAGLASGSVVASDRFFSREFLRDCVFLHEFLRPIGIEEALIGKVASSDGRVALLGVHRGRDRRPFDEDDIAAFAAYLPHLDQALRLRRAFARLETGLDLLGGAVDRLALGVGVYGDEGVVHVNRAARAMAGRADGLKIDRLGTIRASDAKADGDLTRQHAAVRAGGAGGLVRVPRRGDGAPYVVLVAPLPGGGASRGPGREPSLLVLVHDPDADAVEAPETIAAAVGLPPGAARLVTALLQGESAVAYGKRVGLSHDTVRHHLKVAFSRTGARSQAHLLQRVTRALGDIGRRR